MEHPVRVAFCPILFGSNGGVFSTNGLPMINEVDSDGMSVRGACSRAFDCGSCSLMHEWVGKMGSEGWIVGWECSDCLKRSKQEDDFLGGRLLPGFYQAGRNSLRGPDDPGFDKDRPGLEGCTKCGFETSFLQIVLRRGGR